MLRRNRRICIPLMGGLGNQLFQFSVGIYIQKFMAMTPKFSSNALNVGIDTPRDFMLGDLICKDSTCTHSRLFLAISKILSFLVPAVWVSERDFADLPLSRVGKRTRVLLGYFQRSIYIDSVASEILEEMSNSDAFGKVVAAPTVNDIAVHIRFGDYLSNPQTKRVHGLTAMSYYVEAVVNLLSTTSYNKIVIYSDEPKMAHSEFSRAFGPSQIPIVMSCNSTEYEDLAGMSSSKGLVISNSSFSWWAAWIGTQLHDCNVVAPRPWFATPSAADDNLLLDRWTVINRELQP